MQDQTTKEIYWLQNLLHIQIIDTSQKNLLVPESHVPTLADMRISKNGKV